MTVPRDDTRVSTVAKRVKQGIKPLYLRGQRLVARTLFAYSPPELAAAIRSLGIGTGDSVLVHSGFRQVSGFTATPGDVIETMLNVVGGDGHLLMMSIPYRGSSQRYAESDPLFDVVRTPSAVGLISEIFRRRADTYRSLSPLHPVVAHGPLAAWLVADHDKSAYSCGKGTPFERFLGVGGKFLFFDAPYGSLTFMHYVEHMFRDRLPVDLYDAAAVCIRVRDAAGRECSVRQFVFSEAARARRHFTPIEERLRADGLLREVRVGNTRLLSVAASDVVDCAARLIDQGTGFYR
jgi:aminoglycoside 3-N-acetyltransferase